MMRQTFKKRLDELYTVTAADFTFTVECLLLVWSQRPPVVMQMPSAHSPSEQAAVNAVLLLQPLSTDSACQLLQKKQNKKPGHFDAHAGGGQ